MVRRPPGNAASTSGRGAGSTTFEEEIIPNVSPQRATPLRLTAAQSRLAAEWFPYTTRLAAKFAYRLFESPDPVESDALWGLTKAASKYDASRGAFKPFLISLVVGEMRRGLRDRDPRPRGCRTDERDLEKARDVLRQELQAEPTSAQLILRLGWDARRLAISAAMSADRYPTTLDRPAPLSGETLLNVIPAPGRGAHEEWLVTLDLLAGLPADERSALVATRLFGVSQEQWANATGVSRITVSRQAAHAARLLRAA